MTKRRWTLITITLILAGTAWLVPVWGREASALPGGPSTLTETAAGPSLLAGSQAVNLSNSQARGVTSGARSPRIVAGQSQRLYVTWEDVYASTRSETALTRRPSGSTTWTTPQVISSSLNTISEHADIALDASGRLHLTWHEVLGSTNYQFMYQRRSSTGALETTQELGRYTMLPAPVIAIGGDQDVHLAWLFDSGTFDIRHMRSPDAGESWFPFTQAVALPTSSLDAALAVDSSNRAHLVWKEALGTGFAILYRVGTPGAGGTMMWGTVITPSGTLTNCTKPSVALLGNDALIGWGKEISGQKFDIYFSRCSGAACTVPVTLGHRVVVNTADPSQSAPVLAVGSDGTIVAVWHGDQDHDEPGVDTLEEILFTYSTNGGQTWARVINVSRTPGQRSIDPDVALEGSSARIVWRERFSAGPPQAYDVWYINNVYSIYLPLVSRNH